MDGSDPITLMDTYHAEREHQGMENKTTKREMLGVEFKIRKDLAKYAYGVERQWDYLQLQEFIDQPIS